MSERVAIVIILSLLCGCADPKTRAANESASEKRIAAQVEAERQDQAYKNCLWDSTGPFGTASLEVMKYCERKAKQ